jgi:hypothetical protein
MVCVLNFYGIALDRVERGAWETGGTAVTRATKENSRFRSFAPDRVEHRALSTDH